MLVGVLAVLVGYSTNKNIYAICFGVAGLLLAFFVKFFTYKMRKVNGQRIFFSILGILLGFVIGRLLFNLLLPVLKVTNIPLLYIRIIFILSASYFLGIVFYFKSFEIRLFGTIGEIKPRRHLKDEERHENYKILDTSVIIDGRIADISETGFLEGILIIPRFVLNELQQIADSSDSLKRQRGRRGLDILNKMKKGIKTVVQIVDDDFPEIREVDEKLIELAKKFDAKIITNDFNLNKVAQIHGVNVLNINELANALKPIVLPGEELTVHVIREGKDPNQGVGYLEDGTMVVVEDGLQYLGKKIDVVVTSVLQTTAGRMIFAK